MANEANELLLLGLLEKEEMHGYRLHEFLENQLSFVSDLKRPTAYRLLEQLYRRGLVEREAERSGRRPERLVYQITPAGRSRFEKLLRAQLATAERVMHTGNIALLFSDRIPVDERRGLLRRRLASAREQRSIFAEIVNAHASGRTAHLALTHDLAHLDVEIAWLANLIEELKENATS